MGRRLRVDFAADRHGGTGGGGGGGGGGAARARDKRDPSVKPPGCTTVFCGNLPFDMDEDVLREALSGCGAIRDVRLGKDRETGDFKGYAHVQFEQTESTDEAVRLSGTKILNRPCWIDFAKDGAGGGGEGGADGAAVSPEEAAAAASVGGVAVGSAGAVAAVSAGAAAGGGTRPAARPRRRPSGAAPCSPSRARRSNSGTTRRAAAALATNEATTAATALTAT